MKHVILLVGNAAYSLHGSALFRRKPYANRSETWFNSSISGQENHLYTRIWRREMRGKCLKQKHSIANASIPL